MIENVVRTETSSYTTHANSHTSTIDGNANFFHLLPLRTETAQSAPTMMARNFRPDSRRLYSDRGNDIFQKCILSEEVATCLVSELAIF